MKNKVLCTLVLTAVMTVSAFAGASSVAINGEKVDNSSVIEENGITYISVRPLAEALGFDIKWECDNKTVIISNGGPLYITFKIGKNGYTFAKTAPIKLSAHPIIVNSSAYVPIDFVRDILGYEINAEENVLNITTEESEATGVVAEVSEGEILFNDDERGEVILALNTDVIITDNKGNIADISSITVGSKLSVGYGEEMTMSIPPVNNPVSIKIIS